MTQPYEDENTIWIDRNGLKLKIGDPVKVYDQSGIWVRNATVKGKHIQSVTEATDRGFRIVSFDNAELSPSQGSSEPEIVPTKQLEK